MKKRVILIISLGLILGISIFFRSFPIFFPQLKIQAREAVDRTISQSIMKDVQSKFANLYGPAKERLLKSRVAEYKKTNKKTIASQVNNVYKQLKDRFQDDTGQTYIMELDCWHWARYVDNLLKFGHPGDEVIYDKQWDRLMLAPNGMYLKWEQHLYYLTAFLYKAFSIVKNVPFFTFAFYVPLFLAAVFIVVLYLFTYRYSGHIGAIISCLFVGMAPNFLARSCAGWFDKDILNLLYPILIIWTYVVATTSASRKRKLFWLSFSSYWVAVYAYTWSHWWVIFLTIVCYEFLYAVSLIIGHFYLKKKNSITLKQHAISMFSFLFSSFFWILLIAGPDPLALLFEQLTQAIALTKPLAVSIWPNVFFTVGELRRADMHSIARSLGGAWVAVLSVVSLTVLLIYSIWHRKHTSARFVASMILSLWFMFMLYASFKGIRFVMFMLIPLGICLGWAADDLFTYFRIKKNVLGISAVIITSLIFCGFSINRGYKASSNIYPLISDTWYKTLKIIRQETTEDTIVNSWWDFGDWFKVIAQRRVIFDGQSQIFPQAYWMAKVILAHSEHQAIAILRMLNNGGNKVFEIMSEHIEDPLEAVLLLENIMLLEPEKAQQILISYLPLEDTQKVMKLLFYNPSRAIFIVEDTMVPKTGAISYLGNWDFSKVYIGQNFDSREKDVIIDRLVELGRNKQQIQQFYQEAFLITTKNMDDWLSNRLQFYSPLVNGQERDGAVFFDNGFVYNIKKKTLQSRDGHVPRSLFIYEDGDIKESVHSNANVIYSIFIFEDGEDGEEGYKCILLDPPLGRSMLMRLYLLNGKGLRHFKPFIQVDDGNTRIRIFSISW